MLRYSFLEIARNKKRSILLFLVSLFLAAFSGSYFSSITKMQLKLVKVYETIPVTGEIAGRHGSENLTIPYDIIKRILDTGFIKSADLEMRDYAFIIDPLIGRIKQSNVQLWPEIIGVSDITKRPWYDSLTIAYADGYTYKDFASSDKICLISEGDMVKNDIKYGDQVRVLASEYYKEYSSLDEMEGVLFTVCGQYSIDGSIDGSYTNDIASNIDIIGGEMGDIIVPVGALSAFMKELYDNVIPEQDLHKKTSVEKVEFEFQNTMYLKDFRIYLSKTDFGRESYEVKDPRMADIEFRLYDDKLNDVVTPLTHTINILTGAIWVVILVLGVIAYFIAYLTLKTSMDEIWIMRRLGRKKRSIMLALLIELTVPCVISTCLSYIICAPILQVYKVVPFLYFLACYILGCLGSILFVINRPMGEMMNG